MKLSFDFDGTIADTNQMKSKLIKKRFGLDIPPWQCDRTLCTLQIGDDAYHELTKIVYEQASTLKTPPLPEALEYIKKLAEVAELYLLTARPQKRLDYAKEWLEHYNIKNHFKRLLSARGNDDSWRSKLEICQANKFDLLMDDDQHHLESDRVDDIIKVLIKNDCHDKIAVPANTKLVCSWREFYEFYMKDIFGESNTH